MLQQKEKLVVCRCCLTRQGWGNSWGNGASDSSWSNSVKEKRKKSMKSGNLVVKPDFTGFSLAHGLSGYCPDYNTMGRACDGCNRKHIAITKLSQDLQNLQIAHVEQNKASILFTPMAVQRGLKLPNKKKFLVPTRTARLLVRGTRWNVVFLLGQALEDGVDVAALE